jgi:hypothetical protein
MRERIGGRFSTLVAVLQGAVPHICSDNRLYADLPLVPETEERRRFLRPMRCCVGENLVANYRGSRHTSDSAALRNVSIGIRTSCVNGAVCLSFFASILSRRLTSTATSSCHGARFNVTLEVSFEPVFSTGRNSLYRTLRGTSSANGSASEIVSDAGLVSLEVRKNLRNNAEIAKSASATNNKPVGSDMAPLTKRWNTKT